MNHVDQEASLAEVLENLTLGEGLRGAGDTLLTWGISTALWGGGELLPVSDFTWSGLFENGAFGVPFPLIIFLLVWLAFRLWPTSFHQIRWEGFYFPRLKTLGSAMAAANVTLVIWLLWRFLHSVNEVPQTSRDRVADALGFVAVMASCLPITLFTSVVNIGYANLMRRRRHGSADS